ncbi:MAG TPA: nucleotidyltransferase family protein [Pyrinomonadaceae bacterium]|nr:nucleotidyltransferase family protein [Pyrinomonadaceae bacterium]
MTHHAILKWAAGSAHPLPSRVEFDEDTLLDLVDAHNLSGRFLRRLESGTPSWVTPKLQRSLRDLHGEIRSRVIENANAIRELRSRLPSSAGVVIIKGMSTYALVKQDHTMRCGDVDLLTSDSHAVITALSDLGYRQTRAPFLYELGEYTKGAVEFDVHEYFPVYSYSPSLAVADLRPEHHPTVWQQCYQLQQHEIFYDALSSDAILSDDLETKGVPVPDPNILALILCSHAFLNYTNLWSISHREKAYVRLGEIADLFDLTTHPAFSGARFFQLVTRFGAHNAVEWAACVAASLFGKNPLPLDVPVRLDEELPAGRFPRCLWWNFWIDLRSSRPDEFLNRWWLDMTSVVRAIGPNTLPAVNGRTARHSTVSTQAALPLRRFITQTTDQFPVPLDLEVSRSERGIRLDLQFTKELSDAARVRVDFGNAASEWVQSFENSAPSLIGTRSTVSFAETSAGCELAWEFPWEVLKGLGPTDREVSLLAGIAKHSERRGLFASTLIPLKVCFDS